MGYPAAGMRNYLTRLGWAHGDAEIFTSEDAMQMFDLSGIGRAPARLDFKKLENLCGQHIAATPDAAQPGAPRPRAGSAAGSAPAPGRRPARPTQKAPLESEPADAQVTAIRTRDFDRLPE